mgnify:CR=1 FL=1
MKTLLVTTKICRRCNIEQLFSRYRKQKRGKYGFGSVCKTCSNELGRIYWKKNRKRFKKKISSWQKKYREKPEVRIRNIDRSWKKKFGIGYETYLNMLSKQKGVCAICRNKDNQKKRMFLSIDHNHVNNKVRGLLCSNCNCAIGLLGDSLLAGNLVFQLRCLLLLMPI